MDDCWRVIGIDVGYSNLALVVCDVDKEDYEITTVFSKMTDLRRIHCQDDDCMFERHDRKGAHLVHHFIKSMHGWFDSADQIVIEAQPITSTHKDIEQLLVYLLKMWYSVPKNKPKNHVRLLAPRSMHAHFCMSGEKETRRIQIVEITRKYLEHQPAFIKYKQKDHLGDAMGYILFYVQVIMPDVMHSFKPNPFASFNFDASAMGPWSRLSACSQTSEG